MNIFITNVSSSKGLGHISRSIALASHLNKKKNIIFLNNNKNLKYIKKYFKYLEIKKNNKKIIKKIKFIIKKNKKKKCIIFIDDYKISKNFVRKINSLNSIVVEYIPLKKTKHLSSDISICLSKSKNLKKDNKVLLSGKKYFSMEKSALKLIKKNLKKNKIFIFLGGGSDKGTIKKIINNIYNLKINISIDIFSTSLNPLNKSNLSYLKKINKISKNKITYNINAINFLKNLRSSKLAILAPGLTFFESLYFKTPSLLISLNKKQHHHINSYNKFKKNYLGNYKKINFTRLNSKILQNIKKKKKPNKNFLIDGMGHQRILNNIKKIYEKKNFNSRW